MQKEEKQFLVKKLYNDIKFANLSKRVSEKHKDGLGKEHFHISAFYYFLKDNENLKDDEIREVLYANNKFSLLRKLDYAIPNLFEELKEHGITYVENLYLAYKNGYEALNVPRI